MTSDLSARFDDGALFSTAPAPESEGADRAAIRTLIDAWGYFADRRQAASQAALFVPDGVIRTYDADPKVSESTATIAGRHSIEDAVAVLRQYALITHFTGQSTILITGDRAIAKTYCQANHLWDENGTRMLTVMHIRYFDTIVKLDGRWLFDERLLITDWVETRPSSP